MNYKRNSFIVLSMWLVIGWIILGLSIGCQQQQPEPPTYDANVRVFNVPHGDGSPVMTDGIFQPGEWDDAATLTVNDSVSVYFKQYRGHFYLAIDSRNLLAPSIDFYTTVDSINILNLHVSAQLGERGLSTDPNYTGDTTWIFGKTSDWYANECRWNYGLQDSLVNIEGMTWQEAFLLTGFPHEAVEMDILKSKIGVESCLFRIKIREIVFPENTERNSLEGWATFNFD